MKMTLRLLTMYLSREQPQTVALVLAHLGLSPDETAGVLIGLPEAMQGEVAYRMARLEGSSPQDMVEIEGGLPPEVRGILLSEKLSGGGPKMVAEVLNMTGRSTEKRALEHIDAQDPALGEEVRNMMFTFDDIARLTDREIQLILREVDTKDCAIALKGATQAMQDRIFSNVSEEVKGMIQKQMEFSGPVRLSDVEEVQLRIVQTVRQLEEAGKITVVRGESQDVFV